MMEPPPTSFPSPLAGKKIIVAGAGIAGLAFVVSLRSIWKEELGKFPDVTHYERDHGQPDLSREGYSISIRSDEMSAGIQALQQMKILDALLDISITRKGNERGYFGLWSLDWRRLVRVRDEAPGGLPTSGMRIARTKMRRVLLEAATKHGEIVWDVACTAVLPTTDESIGVRLSNGKEDSCDFLVVADGANSKLRSCVRPDDKLNFAGPVSISAISRFSGPSPEPVSRDWGIVPSGQGVALFVSPMGEQSANWSLSYMADAPRREQRQPLSPDLSTQLLQEAKERGAVFKEPFQTLVEHSDTATLMVFNAMDKEPFAHGAANGMPDSIVFIGDSNHAVSPFAGNGANIALKDGYDLAECLCTHKSVEKAVEVYDKRSLPRASISVRTSHVSIAVVHSSGLTWVLYHSLLLLLGGIMSIWYKCKDITYQRRCS